jgi:predicted metalloprotease
MRWRGRRQSDNVEDLRGQNGGFGSGRGPGGGGFRIPIGRSGGGGGLTGIIILVVLFFALRACGIDPMQILVGQDGSQGPGQTQTQAPRQQPAPTQPGQQQTAPRSGDEAGDFAKTVLAETEDVWTGIFKAQGATYQKPTLVLFNDQVRSACGFASAASGPFYCPGDRKLYIDLGFYDQLANQFGASGDFAQAYVLAHEVGHHVQNLIGVLPQFNEMRQRMNQVEANEMSTRVELQADCFAGVWGHFTAQKGLLDDGDIEEALNAAQQIGDDTLQRRTQGYVVPESFNHGTSKQRQTWFARGFKSGKLEDCDTFNSDI